MKNERPPCPALWMTPVVRWDGELHACCADVGGTIRIGNLRNGTFKELWEGENMTAYRILHVIGQFDRMPACRGCAGLDYYSLPREYLEDYLHLVRRADLIPLLRGRLGEPE